MCMCMYNALCMQMSRYVDMCLLLTCFDLKAAPSTVKRWETRVQALHMHIST